MPRVSPDYVPAYRLHKQSGRAIVTLSGRDHVLGAFGSAESRAKYHDLVSRWIANGRKPLGVLSPPPAFVPAPITVATVCDAFQRHADDYYATPGRRSNPAAVFRLVLRDVRDLFGSTPADDFSAAKLKEIRDRWIARGYVRRGINSYAGHVRHVFRWAVAEELVSPAVVQKLQCLDPLKRRRSGAVESKPVRPVPIEHVNAIRTAVARPVWALIQLQLHTGARGDELFRLRAVDLDTAGDVWVYSPAEHKSAGKGLGRMICFGPASRAVLAPFMADRPIDAPLFSPREANAERKAATATKGKPRRPGQRPNVRKTQRRIREAYDDASYRRAIRSACERLGVPPWHPHQLRHNFSTEVRRRHGVEASRIATGHTSIDTTLIYAERDAQIALKIAAEIG